MGRRLRSYVHVYDPNGTTHVFGPDDEVPEQYAAQIGDHAWIGGDADPVEGQSPAGSPVVDTPPVTSGPAAAKVPPRGGPGSGRDAWVAYAEANKVEVTDQMRSRDDVVAALEEAGIPVE